MKTTINQYLKKISKNTGKRLLIMVFAVGMTMGASAQHGGHIGGGGFRGGGYFHGGGYYYPRSYVSVGVGFGLYSPFWPYYGFYSPFGWGYPYAPYYPGYYGGNNMPSRLNLQIQDIKNDYNEQIQATKDDKSLTGKERRERVRELKHDRDAAVIQAQRDYYYNRRSNGPVPYKGNDNNGQSPNNAPQNNNNNNNNNNKPSNNPGTQQSNSSSEQPEYSERGQ